MIKFVTAIVDATGTLIGCQTSDLPLRAENLDAAHTPVSVGFVVCRDGFGDKLSAQLIGHITVTADAGGYRAALAESAREFVTMKIAHPSTMAELEAAPTINPLAAHWIHRQLHADHPLRARLRGEVGNPRHEATVESLRRRRWNDHEITPAQRFEAKAREIQTAASAWQDMTTAIDKASP